VAGSCEPSGSIKGREFLDQLSACFLSSISSTLFRIAVSNNQVVRYYKTGSGYIRTAEAVPTLLLLCCFHLGLSYSVSLARPKFVILHPSAVALKLSYFRCSESYELRYRAPLTRTHIHTHTQSYIITSPTGSELLNRITSGRSGITSFVQPLI